MAGARFRGWSGGSHNSCGDVESTRGAPSRAPSVQSLNDLHEYVHCLVNHCCLDACEVAKKGIVLLTSLRLMKAMGPPAPKACPFAPFICCCRLMVNCLKVNVVAPNFTVTPGLPSHPQSVRTSRLANPTGWAQGPSRPLCAQQNTGQR